MRTINFRDGILYAIAYMLGLKPGSTLSKEKAEALVNYINRRVEQYWDRADWPEWILTEPRTPDASHIVAWNQAGKNVIEKVFRVYLRDPNTVKSGGVDTPFRLTSAGIYCGLEHGTQVWLKYFPRPENWTTAPIYNSANSYTAGDLVYDTATGECYRALVNQAAPAAPLTDAAKWTQLLFPYALAGAVRHGAYADALKEDGQHEKAAAEENMAEQLFAAAAGVLSRANVDILSDQESVPPRYHGPVRQAAAA